MSEMIGMKYFCLLLIILNCHAEEVTVDSLGQGSCWYQYQNKEILKLSSFNDRESVSLSNERLSAILLNLIPHESKEIQSVFLHCGSQGASLVARIKTESGNLCLWAMPDHGKFKTRSLGGTAEIQKGGPKLCDGYKQGELLIVIKNQDYFNQLITDEKWNGVIKEVIPVAFKFYKIKLTPEYFLHEEEVARMLQESFGIAVEYNQYQHGIGEYVQLK